MCGGKDRFRFSDKGYGRWFCRGCGDGSHGPGGSDGIDLVMRIKRVDFVEAARLIEGVIGKTSSTARANGADKRPDPLRSWREASPNVLSTTVDVYLRGRAIRLTAAEACSLRFHPALWHWLTRSKWPAIIAPVGPAGGAPVTCHQTFLDVDGSGKAPLERPRLFPAGVAPIGGVWFGKADPGRTFVIAEGIESLLSALRLFGAEAGCAALSEGGIRRLVLPPEARKIRIFADHDELQQGLAAAVEARLRWRAEGREVAISHAREIGEDANDVWMRRQRVQAHV
jgi:putative DNA primase/helicase